MKLYIAEKPSMAAEIAKYLPGPVSRKDGYITTGDGVITWGYGHILRQAEPDEYDPKYGKCRISNKVSLDFRFYRFTLMLSLLPTFLAKILP